jgi:hypothetical protein
MFIQFKINFIRLMNLLKPFNLSLKFQNNFINYFYFYNFTNKFNQIHLNQK